MRKRYNKTYAGRHTKRELRKRVNSAWTLIIILLAVGVYQEFTLTSNDMTIPATPEVLVVEELPPPELKPLAVLIDTPENKELAVKPKMAKDLNSERQEVIDYIIQETTKQGLNTELYLAIINCESGFNTNARNSTSTATGICQFTRGTFLDGIRWRGLDWTLNDRLDYKKSLDMMIWFVEVKKEISRWECIHLI